MVNTQHGLYAQESDPLGKRLACYSIERLAAAFSDVELVQNEEGLATLRRLRVPAHKLVLFGNGIDLERFDPDRFDESDRAWARLVPLAQCITRCLPPFSGTWTALSSTPSPTGSPPNAPSCCRMAVRGPTRTRRSLSAAR